MTAIRQRYALCDQCNKESDSDDKWQEKTGESEEIKAEGELSCQEERTAKKERFVNHGLTPRLEEMTV